jgi:hypothetical protein
MADKKTLVNPEWDFKKSHVQEDLSVGEHLINSESIVLCAGPNTVASANNANLLDQLYPIGLLESAAVIQNKQIQQLFEIGSKKSFVIPGRTRIQVGLSRVIFNGDSLMGALYRGVTAATGATSDDAGDAPGTSTTATTSNDVEIQGNFWMNLTSDFFNKPLGLAMLFADSDSDYITMVYFENCMIQSHQMTVGANQTVVMENANLICDSVTHVAMQATS